MGVVHINERCEATVDGHPRPQVRPQSVRVGCPHTKHLRHRTGPVTYTCIHQLYMQPLCIIAAGAMNVIYNTQTKAMLMNVAYHLPKK